MEANATAEDAAAVMLEMNQAMIYTVNSKHEPTGSVTALQVLNASALPVESIKTKGVWTQSLSKVHDIESAMTILEKMYVNN